MPMAGTTNDDSFDIENPATSLRRELESIHRPFSKDFCIYRVPDRLRESNEIPFTPRIVSIGPLHHGKEKYKEMEEYKRKCLQDFLERTEVSLEEFIEIIERKEDKLRNCYAEIIGLSSHDFVKMILVDAAFIFEVFVGSFSDEVPIDDRIFSRPWLETDVKYDMFLLENQLPFFILEDLFMVADIHISSNGDGGLSMLKLTHSYSKIQWDISNPQKDFDEISCFEVSHFVDFVRSLALPIHPITGSEVLTTPSATELLQAGIKFKVGSSTNLFDIKFNTGILEIPTISMNDPVESILRNILAFEQLHCSHNFINDYVVLMNFLLRTSKDVDLLIQEGIILNWSMDNEGPSTLFHNLVKVTAVDPDNYYFSSLAEKVNRYCKAPWHSWMATLKHDYFNTPWASVSVAAAIFLLALTVIQTVCSILQGK